MIQTILQRHLLYREKEAWTEMDKELWLRGTPEDAADMAFVRIRDNWYNLCCLDSQTEYLNVVFEDYQQKQASYADEPTRWSYRFYTQFLKHRD